jgi:hypothetical protein
VAVLPPAAIDLSRPAVSKPRVLVVLLAVTLVVWSPKTLATKLAAGPPLTCWAMGWSVRFSQEVA